MISTELAQKLRDAGLKWEHRPDDSYTFEPQTIQPIIKRPDSPGIITVEAGRYSLDNPCAVRRYTLLKPSHAVWLPSLEQLLEEIEKRGWEASIELTHNDQPAEYRCIITHAFQGRAKFTGPTSEESAGLALLWLLERPD